MQNFGVKLANGWRNKLMNEQTELIQLLKDTVPVVYIRTDIA